MGWGGIISLPEIHPTTFITDHQPFAEFWDPNPSELHDALNILGMASSGLAISSLDFQPLKNWFRNPESPRDKQCDLLPVAIFRLGFYPW